MNAVQMFRQERKRLRAVMFGYCGTKYNGLQSIQLLVPMPDPPPILRGVEDELHRALFLSGAFSQDNSNSLGKISWSRSSRTDSKVHACGNVVACKIVIPNAQVAAEGDVSPEDEAKFVSTVNSHLPKDICVFSIIRTMKTFNARFLTSSRRYCYYLPKTALSPASITKLGELLPLFVGTHSFHNYSSGIFPGNPRCCRTIGSAGVKINGDFVEVRFQGNSFVKHHIRRMVGFAFECAVRMEDDAKSLVLKSLQPNCIVPQGMPRAPAEGLCLEWLDFDDYTKKQEHNAEFEHTGNLHRINTRIDFASPRVREAKEEFTSKVIIPEIQQQIGPVFDEWISSRTAVNFPPTFEHVETSEISRKEEQRQAKVRELKKKSSKRRDFDEEDDGEE